MAFNGVFLKLYNKSTGKYDSFPNKYIFKESYVGAREVQDVDSGRTADGKMKRNVVNHVAHTIDFTTPPMWNTEMNNVFKNFINTHYVQGGELERKLKIQYYENESDSYLTGEFYLATPKFSVNRIDGNKILYNSIEMHFVEY